MKYTIVAYKDIDLDKFNTPAFMPFGVEDVCETIVDGVKKGKIEGAESLEAYHLGSYDSSTGEISLNAKPVKILELKAYVRKEA